MCEAQRILSSLVLNINCKIYINQRSGGDFIYSSEAFHGLKSDMFIFPHFQDSDSSDEDMSSFIDNHRRSMSIQRERESILRRRDK